MKNSKQKQELIDSIKEMEDVYNDADTPADIKNSLEPSIRNAKEQLKQLEQAEQQEQTTVKAEKKVPKAAPPAVKKKKAVAKKKAATTVRKVKKRISDKLPSIKAVLKRAQAALTKVKGRTPRGKEADASRKALPPGTRISKSGNEYREYRENRADVQRKKVPYLAYGGTVATIGTGEGVQQVNVFGYNTKYFPQELIDQFKKAIAKIETDPDKDDIYYHNITSSLKELAAKVDNLMMSAQTNGLVGVIGATLFIGAFNYRSGMHIETDVLRDSIARAFYDAGKKFGRGGIVGSTELRRHVYEKMKNAGIDTEEFNQMVANVSWDVMNGPTGLDEEYEGYVTTKDKIDDILQKADIPDTLYYDLESGAVSESEPDYQEGEEWYEVKTKRMLFGDLAQYFRRGGRIKSAINRDRAYKSDEPWEKRYKRKSRPGNPRYSRYAEGGQLKHDKKYNDLYSTTRGFIKDLQRIAEQQLDGEEQEDVEAIAYWLEGSVEQPDQSKLFIVLIYYIDWLSDLFEHWPELFKNSFEKVKKSLQKFKWFIYDEKGEGIIAAFLDTKDADRFVKELKTKEPSRIVEGYSATHLKKMGKDPLNYSSWFGVPNKEMARGGKFEINPEYLWFVYHPVYKKIVAGNEYYEDAWDAKKEIGEAYPNEPWKVWSEGNLKSKGIDPFDSNNWSNPGDVAQRPKDYVTDHIYNIKLKNGKLVSDDGGFPYFYNRDEAEQKINRLFRDAKFITAKPKFALFDEQHTEPLFYFRTKDEAMRWWKNPSSGQEIRPVSTVLDKAFLGMTLINSIDNLAVAKSQGADAM